MRGYTPSLLGFLGKMPKMAKNGQKTPILGTPPKRAPGGPFLGVLGGVLGPPGGPGTHPTPVPPKTPFSGPPGGRKTCQKGPFLAPKSAFR